MMISPLAVPLFVLALQFTLFTPLAAHHEGSQLLPSDATCGKTKVGIVRLEKVKADLASLGLPVGWTKISAFPNHLPSSQKPPKKISNKTQPSTPPPERYRYPPPKKKKKKKRKAAGEKRAAGDRNQVGWFQISASLGNHACSMLKFKKARKAWQLLLNRKGPTKGSLEVQRKEKPKRNERNLPVFGLKKNDVNGLWMTLVRNKFDVK